MAEKRKVHPNTLKNLMPIQEVNAKKTREERIESARKAGKASAQKRRDNRTLKEICLDILSSEAPEEDIKRYGLPEGTSNSVVMTVAAAKKAREGDLKAQEYLRDTAGQMPTKEVNLSADIVTEADKKLIDKVAARIRKDTE